MTVFISKKHKTPLALNSSKTFFSKVAQVAPPAQVAPFYGTDRRGSEMRHHVSRKEAAVAQLESGLQDF